jgi:hypothetical protein
MRKTSHLLTTKGAGTKAAKSKRAMAHRGVRADLARSLTVPSRSLDERALECPTPRRPPEVEAGQEAPGASDTTTVSTDGMEDQVGKAIAKADGACFDSDPPRYRKLAFAALEPLARPTEAMVDAAHEAVWFDAFWAINGRADFKKAVRACGDGALGVTRHATGDEQASLLLPSGIASAVPRILPSLHSGLGRLDEFCCQPQGRLCGLLDFS